MVRTRHSTARAGTDYLCDPTLSDGDPHNDTIDERRPARPAPLVGLALGTCGPPRLTFCRADSWPTNVGIGWRIAPEEPRQAGYTTGMKTAVSIPDDVFEKVDRFARRAKRSRSEVFSAALREYIARHAPDEVTDAINRAVDEIGDQRDEFVAAAARRVLEKTEW